MGQKLAEASGSNKIGLKKKVKKTEGMHIVYDNITVKIKNPIVKKVS